MPTETDPTSTTTTSSLKSQPPISCSEEDDATSKTGEKVLDFIDPKTNQRTIISSSAPEEIVESTVSTMTTNNPDGSLNRTTKRTTRTTTKTTTVRKICLTTTTTLDGETTVQATPILVSEEDASSEQLKEAAAYVTGSPSTALLPITDTQKPQINTVTSEMVGPTGRTCATFVYMSPTLATEVAELEEDDPESGGKIKKLVKKTVTTSAAATAVVKKDGSFIPISGESPEALMRLQNLASDQQETQTQQQRLLDDTQPVDEQEMETWTSPDGQTTTKTTKRVLLNNAGGERKNPQSPVSTLTTTTTTTRRKLLEKGSSIARSSLRAIRSAFGSAGQMGGLADSSSEQINELQISSFIPTDPFGQSPSIFDFDFNLIDISDENSALDQMRKSEQRFNERIKAMSSGEGAVAGRQRTVKIEEEHKQGMTTMTEVTTTDEDGNQVTKIITTTSGSPFAFSSMFAALPLYQGYGMLGQAVSQMDSKSPQKPLALEAGASPGPVEEKDVYHAPDLSSLVDPSFVTKWLEDYSAQLFQQQATTTVPAAPVAPVEQQEDEKPTEILSVASTGPFRIAWMDRPEVKSKGYFEKITRHEIELQEAMFEVVTTEASYNQSLKILVNHFYWAREFTCSDSESNSAPESSSTGDDVNSGSTTPPPILVMSALEKRHLFSNILCVFLSSSAFMRDLEIRWSETAPHLTDVCDIILAHVEEKNFDPYIMYLRNQAHQIKTLNRLYRKGSFRQVLDRLHADSVVQKHRLDSFLSLPMQRLMRLRLLVQTIAKSQLKVNRDWDIAESEETKPKRKVTEAELRNVQNALHVLDRLIRESESEKKNMDDKARLLELVTNMEFPEQIRALSIGDQKLLKEGELRGYRKKQTVFGGKKYENLHLILLSKTLIVTKVKNGRYKVLDYCPNEQVEALIKYETVSVEQANNSASSEPSDNHHQNSAGRSGSKYAKKDRPVSPAHLHGLTKANFREPIVLDLHLSQAQNNSCAHLQLTSPNDKEIISWHELFTKPTGGVEAAS